MTDAHVRSICARFGALSGFLAVAFGAFGAHALREVAAFMERAPTSVSVWQTAVLYQMVHALALLALAGLPPGLVSARHRLITGASFALGSLLFSGSLYILAVTGVSAWGMLTPVGGLLFLSGWGTLFMALWWGTDERQ